MGQGDYKWVWGHWSSCCVLVAMADGECGYEPVGPFSVLGVHAVFFLWVLCAALVSVSVGSPHAHLWSPSHGGPVLYGASKMTGRLGGRPCLGGVLVSLAGPCWSLLRFRGLVGEAQHDECQRYPSDSRAGGRGVTVKPCHDMEYSGYHQPEHDRGGSKRHETIHT